MLQITSKTGHFREHGLLTLIMRKNSTTIFLYRGVNFHTISIFVSQTECLAVDKLLRQGKKNT